MRDQIVANLTRAWNEGWDDEIRAAITAYQADRARIDAEQAEVEAHEEGATS